ILKCPDCDREIRIGKTRDLNKHMNLNGNLCKGQCQPALLIMQNVGNVTPKQNIPQNENHISKNDKEWYDLMEIDNEKDSEPSDSEYDTAEEKPDIHFEKIKDSYINRIAEARKFNEDEVCDYYAFVPKEYYAEGEPLVFFESIEEKIVDIYKKELALKAEEVFLEISAFRPLQGSSYLPLPEALDKPQLGIINPQNRDDNECFKWCISAYYTREKAIKASRKPPHLNEIRRLRRNTNIANFEGIKFPATLHDIDKFKESNSNYAINIFKPFYREAFGKIKVDIDPLHISERNYQVEHMIDLLYLIEGSNKASQHLILPEEEAKEIEADEKDKEENTKKETKQIVVSYGYTIHCLDGTTQKPVINRELENIIKDLMENLQENLEVILDKLCEIALCEKMTPELW
ncbi:19035_t:CDS:2, partial [Dentiscutata erythropus]